MTKRKLLALSIALWISLSISTFVTIAEEENSVSWVPITKNGFGNPHNVATRAIGLYKGDLYIGTQSGNGSKKLSLVDVVELARNILNTRNFGNTQPFLSSVKSDGCEIWKYNFTTAELQQIVGNQPEATMGAGFGDSRNTQATFFREFKGKLYVGTSSSPTSGCKVWRYDGNSWEQVVERGFGDPSNFAVWSCEVFKDQIYVGMWNCNNSKTGFCQIWRSSDGISWTKVVDRGFRDFDVNNKICNKRVWSMIVYKEFLYVGTWSSGNNGCQLWETSDGENWIKVKLPGGDGFGDRGNDGISAMEIYNGWLYVGTAALDHLHGFEIWKYNGTNWIPVIGDDVPGVKWNPWHEKNDGFGDRWNWYAYSMINASDKLWVGTVNPKGCEVHCFNGDDWIQVVGDDRNSEIGRGFGNGVKTSGVRSMIEYPSSSGNIFVGTSVSSGSLGACQLWMRRIN